MDSLKENNKHHYRAIINTFFFLFCLIYLCNYSLCQECPRSKPILKDNECQSIYCSSREYDNKTCIIANSFVKSQWLNHIHIFALYGISHIWTTSNEKGDLFLMAQGFSDEDESNKYIYAFHKDGNGLFFTRGNNKNEFYAFEKIDFFDDKYPEIFYTIEIDQIQYLLSTQTENEMFLVDYRNKNFSIFSLNTTASSSDILFKLKVFDDEKDNIYFNEYVLCEEYSTSIDCFLGLRIFELNLNNINILIEKDDEILVNPLSKIDCFQNDDLYIQCIYTNLQIKEDETEVYNRVIALFDNKNLNIEYIKILQDNYNKFNSFESTIQLNGNSFVTGFSEPHNTNIIKLLFKKFVITSSTNGKEIKLENYLPNLEYININEDNQYIIDKGIAKRNDMIKISETKFAILLNEFSRTSLNSSFNRNILILIINIFDNSKISIRHYKVNLELYDLLVLEDLRGFTLNNFFGVLLETGEAINTNTYMTKAIFLTFGYVNSTFDDIPIDKNLKENDIYSVFTPGNYITQVENNLFGYKFTGIQIINLPNTQVCGYFIKSDTSEIIKVGDLINKDTILRFVLVREIIIGDECSIDFAGVVEEPDFNYMNENAERVDIYPVNDTEIERGFYSPKTLIGRVIKYRFDISCFDSCQSCDKLTNNPDDQHCLQCKENYYFKEGTQNCFDSLNGYYLNKETETFFPCDSSCSSCDGPKQNNIMNCLSCHEGFILYDSKNCLNCDNKYVNFDLTECIDEIPEGYYLIDQTLHTIGKCHELCKTCNGAPVLWSMNCIECKYYDPNFEPSYEGNCPTQDGDYSEEEEIIMPGGECPKNKPILVRKDFCFNGYCSPEEFNDETCIISNSIIKTQWMNNIQKFGEGNLNNICLDYGYNGDLFLLAQKRENGVNENTIYGFNKDGSPLFYDQDKDEYFSYKTMKFPNDLFLENIKFVKNSENDNIFLLSNQLVKEMYEINYKEDKTISHAFENPSYSSEKILALKINDREYISYFIYCEDNTNKCFPYFRKFQIYSDDNQLKIIKEMKADVNINSENNFICIENSENLIQCIFSEKYENSNDNKLILSFFDIDTFENKYTFNLEPKFFTVFFDSMISLNDNAFVISFSIENNIVRVLLKTIEFDNQNLKLNLINYIEGIDYININEDGYFSLESFGDRDSLCRINDNKFAILLDNLNEIEPNTFGNPSILIYIFTIFNEHKNVNIRRYSINFKLYNMLSYGSILGYNLGQFFGILMELSSPTDKAITNSGFMTFGYVNSTYSSIIFNNEFIPNNSLLSRSLVLGNYIGKIENNLFGYESLSVIILSLPDESVGYFIKNNNEKIIINEILNLNSEIKFKLNDNYIPGLYSLIFAGSVKEPEYDKMNKYADQLLSYPIDSNVDEKEFYEPQILIGRNMEFRFEVKAKKDEPDDNECYPSCSSCYSYSADDDNHLCKICKPGYYFQEDTYNCFKEMNEYYYFDEENEIFSPCYEGCLTCSDKEINSTYMNCLSCESEYYLYEKSHNCLKCPKYVNYLQTECIDEIPEGYYLSNQKKGIIEKCHIFCKTCKGGSFVFNDTFYMNCETCLYTNKYFEPDNIGDCPSNEIKDDDGEECYSNCKTCSWPSNDKYNQKCITCKDGYYFQDGTNNCFSDIDSHYYFNEITKTFSPCYKDCFTCSTKEDNTTHMNCLSCPPLYKFYKKSSNCLSCPKYVNYLQTGCINTIPEGYYLSDGINGIIEKCHSLCKTCKGGLYIKNSITYMNCETCLYPNNSNVKIEGNCPFSNGSNRRNKKSSNSFAIWISVLSIIFISIIIGIIVYIKCFKNKGIIKKNDNTDYYNIDKKNVAFDDENSSGIN